MKHNDNLKIEGSHQMKRESNAVLVGERAAVVKHQDNLKMEGKMESRTQAAVVKGERAEVKRRTDNLKMEGSMQGIYHLRLQCLTKKLSFLAIDEEKWGPFKLKYSTLKVILKSSSSGSK